MKEKICPLKVINIVDILDDWSTLYIWSAQKELENGDIIFGTVIANYLGKEINEESWIPKSVI